MLKIIYEQSCEIETYYPQFIDEETRALREDSNLTLCPSEFKHMPCVLHTNFQLSDS